MKVCSGMLVHSITNGRGERYDGASYYSRFSCMLKASNALAPYLGQVAPNRRT